MASNRQNPVDNLTQVADDIIDYILKNSNTIEAQQKHKDELIDILGQVKQQYKQANHSYPVVSRLEKWVYKYSRQRSAELNMAFASMKETNACDQLILLDIIVGLLQQGKCDSTSANTALINKLIEKAQKYNNLDKDERFNIFWDRRTVNYGIREALRHILVKRAKEVISEYQKEIEQTRVIITTEKPKVGKLNINTTFAKALTDVLVKPEYEPKELKPAAKLDKEKYTGVMATLEKVYGAQKKIPVVFAKPEEQKPAEPNKEFVNARETLFAFFKTREKDDEVAAQASPSLQR